MEEKLNEYKQKRNFANTNEPEGRAEEAGENLRFVVQYHIARSKHYDFRLEWDGALLSWAVPKGPSYNTRDKRLAVKVEDHPLEYRNFEGTIPKGEYGGGTVMIWDEGSWDTHADVTGSLKEGVLKFSLNGRRLRGKWALVRMKAKEGEKGDNWLLLKEKDEYSKEESGITEFKNSVRSGRSLEEIEEGEDERLTRNPFENADAQLAELVNTVPEGDNWLYEVKYDGYRIMAYMEGNNIRLLTRKNSDYTNRFKSVANALLDLASGRAMVLDGEMTVIDSEGKADFQALQSYMKNSSSHNLVYIVFDILALDGEDIRGRELIRRKEILQSLMVDAPSNLHYSGYLVGSGEESFAAACKLKMEGIVGKRVDSVYSGCRNGDWIKLKCDKREEFVIGGYTLSEKRSSGVSALLLGAYEDNELIYVGRAGTGISRVEMRVLREKFERLETSDAPFSSAPAAKTNEKITWLSPELVAEIKFAEWTNDGLLRQASYKGLRTDRVAGDIRNEKTANDLSNESSGSNENNENDLVIDGIKISSPDKIIFKDPEIKKAEVAEYYSHIAERMLPYVRHRILSIVRCPKGVSQSCFYKKHPDTNRRGIETISLLSSDGETGEFFYITNKSGLVSEAQMGTLEFHIWGSLIDELERPNIMVFDLDPDEGMDIEKVRQGVRDIKAVLTELSIKSYLKTSGGKGYHVVVPLRPNASWDTFREFAKRVAELVERKWPERYTSNIRKNARKGKIFIDWIRNARGATSVAPYSLRAREGAAVSMPIDWEELDEVAPDSIGMKDALLRLDRSDPWGDFFDADQLLK